MIIEKIIVVWSRVCFSIKRPFLVGCQTCDCIDEPQKSDEKCLPINCALDCKYGLQQDLSGCQVCTCNSCPQRQCRMYCAYGFKKNPEDGCDMCECDSTPIADNIKCDEVRYWLFPENVLMTFFE